MNCPYDGDYDDCIRQDECEYSEECKKEADDNGKN